MALISTTAKQSEPTLVEGAIAPATPPAQNAPPISQGEARVLTHALKAPMATPIANPVAEVQAKLRAALDSAPKTSKFSEFAFKTLVTMACILMISFGVMIGIACVLLGAAIYLFPSTTGLSLAAAVIGGGFIGYTLYTRTPKDKFADASDVKPSDLFEPLAIGRLSVAGVA